MVGGTVSLLAPHPWVLYKETGNATPCFVVQYGQYALPRIPDNKIMQENCGNRLDKTLFNNNWHTIYDYYYNCCSIAIAQRHSWHTRF